MHERVPECIWMVESEDCEELATVVVGGAGVGLGDVVAEHAWFCGRRGCCCRCCCWGR